MVMVGNGSSQLGLGFDTMGAEAPTVRDGYTLLSKLKYQRWLIATLAISLFLCLAVAAQLLPPKYSASAQVTVDSRTPRPPVRGSDVEEAKPFAEDVIGTEMAVLSSREFMSQVVARLHLDEDPHYNLSIKPSLAHRWKRWAYGYLADFLPSAARSASENADSELADTIDAVTSSVKLTSLPKSRVIEITTSAADPKTAADISNLITELYISARHGLTKDMNVDANDFLTKRLAELQTSATNSAQEIEQYRREAGLTAGATSTLLQEQISHLERDLLDASARQSSLQAQYDAAKTQNPEQLSVVVNSQTMSRLRESEASISSKVTEIQSRFGPRSPEIVAYLKMLADIHTKISDEAARAVQGIKIDLASANANVALLTERERAMKQRLEKMNAARAHLETLQAQSTAAYNLYTAFLNRSGETAASLLFPSTDVRIVSRASIPVWPIFPRNIFMIPAAAIVSVAFACAVALLIESRKRGITSSTEIEALFQLTTLALIPFRERKVPTIYRDAIENLLNRLYFGLNARSVLITSALPGEGKTTTAAALAEAASARGLRVVLIDGDLRSLDQVKRGAPPASGFSEVLRGVSAANEVMQVSAGSSLAVLPSGGRVENPISLLSLPAAQHTFEALSRSFDLIIIDSPPVLVGGDCWMLSQHVDRTVMIVKWRSTSRKCIATALQQLTSSPFGTDSLSKPASHIVFNMVDRFKSRRLDNVDSSIFAPAIDQYYR
jgi:succinoglycan biosynthesis transport protein ExoP